MLSGPLKVFSSGNFTSKTAEMERALKAERKAKLYRVVVLECKANSLGVHWQCKTNDLGVGENNSGNSYSPPGYTLSGDDLAKVRTLNVFEPCTIQIGDRNFYTIKEGDEILTKELWKRREREALKIPLKPPKKQLGR